MRTRAVAASLDHSLRLWAQPGLRVTAEVLEAWELARSDLCIGCAGPRTPPGSSGLWCPACWKVCDQTGSLPDLLFGGKALRRG